MTQPTHLFPDVWTLAAHVATSRDAAGAWTVYPGLNNSALRPQRPWAGRSLEHMLEQCHHLNAPELLERTQEVSALTDDLIATLPQGQIPRRTGQWDRHGSRLSMDRILQGSHTPWRRFVRRAIPGGAPLYLIALCTSYSGFTEHQTIIWTMIASLALADALIKQGARVELWDCTMNPDTYQSGNVCTLTLTRLYRSSEAWNLQDVVLASDPAWFRRLHFRLWEMGQTATRHLHEGYGRVATPWQMEARLTGWARDVHPQARLLMGAHVDAAINNARKARRWIEAQLAQLSEAA